MAKESKKPSIGFVYSKNFHDELDDDLIKILERRMNVVHLPIEELEDLSAIQKRVKDCKVVFNDSTFEPITFEAIELSKTLEELGMKVINSSHSFFYQEDKWMFYLKCLEHRLPTPKTYFIPKGRIRNPAFIKEILEEGPLVLKAIFSDRGQCVEKVTSYDSLLKKLHRIAAKNPISPIIAQRYIPSNHRCYRVTLINHRAVQAIVKIGKSWKETGDPKKDHFRKIKMTGGLKEMCEKASRAFGMELCGLDLILANGRWHIIEANSSPALCFIIGETKKLMDLLADYLYSECRKAS
ncbi:MAG: hypothetical protein JXB14_05095 [Candidatus Altiarchaeota archaeon]|nr:hypothetical protein [Candidatus Altiarchaeota archaeon]